MAPSGTSEAFERGHAGPKWKGRRDRTFCEHEVDSNVCRTLERLDESRLLIAFFSDINIYVPAIKVA